MTAPLAPPSALPTPRDLEIRLPSGRLAGQQFGPDDAPLVIAIPGLSATMKSFDYLAERVVASLPVRLVALDLRGRGRSEVTPPGTYGWVNHARDVLGVADALYAERFSVIGHSMGGAVAMTVAHLAADRLDGVVLLDICGVPDAAALVPIGAAIARLGTVHPSVEAYIAAVRAIGSVDPWNEYWEGTFRYELQPVDGGVAARSDAQAVLEDAAFGAGASAFGEDSGVYALWRSLRMPVLLLRAARQLLPGCGYIVRAEDRDRFRATVASAEVVEVDANHYGIVTHPATVAAVVDFLSRLARDADLCGVAGAGAGDDPVAELRTDQDAGRRPR